MARRTLLFAVLLGAARLAHADAVDDPRASMREAAIEQAELTPPAAPTEVSVYTQEHAAERHGESDSQTARDEAHRAAVQSARDAALAGAMIAPAIAPARGATARNAAQNSNQRGAAAASLAKAVRGGRPAVRLPPVAPVPHP